MGRLVFHFPSFPAFLFATGITFSMTPWKGQAGPMKPTNDTKQIPVETGRDETLMGFANGRIVRAPLRLIAFGGRGWGLLIADRGLRGEGRTPFPSFLAFLVTTGDYLCSEATAACRNGQKNGGKNIVEHGASSDLRTRRGQVDRATGLGVARATCPCRVWRSPQTVVWFTRKPRRSEGRQERGARR